MKEMREKAASKALGNEEEDVLAAGEDTEAAVEEEVVAEDEMAGAGEIPPQVVEALEGLPVPVLQAIRDKIDEIIAGKEGGDAEEMAGADVMGGAPPMPMPAA